jgi:hypothetical protein
VRPDSLLLDELDVDSITLIELAFAIEKEFGVDFPEVKATEETFTVRMPDAIRMLEKTDGGMTFFEFIKAEALRTLAPDEDVARRNELFETLPLAALVAAVGARVPDGIDGTAPLASLTLYDLFRFLTVRTLARYVTHLVATAETVERRDGEARWS